MAHLITLFLLSLGLSFNGIIDRDFSQVDASRFNIETRTTTNKTISNYETFVSTENNTTTPTGNGGWDD